MNTKDELELVAEKIEQIAQLWSEFAEAYILSAKKTVEETTKDL